MKKLSVSIIYIFLLGNLYANDAWVKSAGGSYTLLGNKNQNVKMASENIRIDLYKDHYEMNIEFAFFNYGETVELKVGFPEYSYGTGEITNIRNFKTTINNKDAYIETFLNDDASSRIKQWYVKDVVFKSNEYTKIIVRYDADFSIYGYDKAVEYLYGTGSTWMDAIDKITIEIVNHPGFWLSKIEFGTEYRAKRISDEVIEIQAENISPDIDDTFSIIFSEYPAFEWPPFGVTERRWLLRNTVIRNDELALLNDEQLRIMRNSIYAYHGYNFNSKDLKDYFNKQEWYKIKESFSENDFSENERINIQNILNEEIKRNR